MPIKEDIYIYIYKITFHDFQKNIIARVPNYIVQYANLTLYATYLKPSLTILPALVVCIIKANGFNLDTRHRRYWTTGLATCKCSPRNMTA